MGLGATLQKSRGNLHSYALLYLYFVHQKREMCIKFSQQCPWSEELPLRNYSVQGIQHLVIPELASGGSDFEQPENLEHIIKT